MVEFRTLFLNELEKWFDFLTNEIFIGAPQDYFPNQWYCDENSDLSSIFVAVDQNGNLLGTIRIFLRQININGSIVTTGGIGAVGTKKEYRGLGLSTKLFEMCQEYMCLKGIKISYLLCAEHNEKFYNRFSYQRIPFLGKISNLEKSMKLDKDFTLRDAVFPDDISILSVIYDNFSGKHNGTVVRNTEYWEKWIPAFKGDKYLIAIDENMSPIAYINVSLENKRLFVYDFGYMEGYDNIFDSLISKLAGQFDTDELQVKYQSGIKSYMNAIEQGEICCVMFKLINAFAINSIKIENTQELIDILKGDSCQTKLLLWRVDDI